jgi:exosortase
MIPPGADRRLAWILSAAVSVAVVAAMLLFPYASGYGLRSDPLWRLLLMLWNASDEWKHGMFVFPIAAVLLFMKRNELAKVPIKGSSWGLLLIVPSLFFYWVGFVANVQYMGYLAIQLMLGACVIWFLGVRFFKAIFFIWCFLFFAYPFIFLEDLVAFPLRLLMSEASVWFLNLIGFHSIRDGTSIVSAADPDPVAAIVYGQRYRVDVADPCSGIRSLFALTMFSALVGILSFRAGWKVMILFAAALPLAVFGNFCRILMLTFGTIVFGSDLAVGTLEHPTWFHLASGFVVYIAALTGIFLFAWLLNGRLGIRRRQVN